MNNFNLLQHFLDFLLYFTFIIPVQMCLTISFMSYVKQFVQYVFTLNCIHAQWPFAFKKKKEKKRDWLCKTLWIDLHDSTRATKEALKMLSRKDACFQWVWKWEAAWCTPRHQLQDEDLHFWWGKTLRKYSEALWRLWYWLNHFYNTTMFAFPKVWSPAVLLSRS